ncbi:MAG: toprim domain-containing protein, partial [Gammaproteobacteria bacterium]
GSWHIFEAEGGKQGGDLFSLIQRETCTDFNAALILAAEWVGTAPSNPEITIINQNYSRQISDDKSIKTQEDLAKIEKAKYLYSISKPLTGTLAEKYLKQHRGIQLGKWPESLRFLPTNTTAPADKQFPPSLLTKAENAKGEIEAVQLIYLDKQSSAKADIDVQKRQFGRMRFGAYAVIQDGNNSKIMIAEGVETALSIAQANPKAKVVTTLSGGNLTNIKLPDDTKEVVICADNDKGKEHAMKVLAPAIERFHEQGKQVAIVFPTIGEPQHDKDGNLKKIDFNDVHKILGIDAVKEQTKQPEQIESTKNASESQPENSQKDVIKDLFNISEKSFARPAIPSKNILDIVAGHASYSVRTIDINDNKIALHSSKDSSKNLDEILQSVQKNKQIEINTSL